MIITRIFFPQKPDRKTMRAHQTGNYLNFKEDFERALSTVSSHQMRNFRSDVDIKTPDDSRSAGTLINFQNWIMPCLPLSLHFMTQISLMSCQYVVTERIWITKIQVGRSQRSQREFFGTIHSFHVKAHTLDNTDISRKLLILQTHQVVKPMYLTVYLSDPKCLFKR